MMIKPSFLSLLLLLLDRCKPSLPPSSHRQLVFCKRWHKHSQNDTIFFSNQVWITLKRLSDPVRKLFLSWYLCFKSNSRMIYIRRINFNNDLVSATAAFRMFYIFPSFFKFLSVYLSNKKRQSLSKNKDHLYPLAYA